MPANLNRKQQREIKAVVERAKKDNGIPQTAQQSIPFQRMFPDGICRVTDSYYTKTIQFQDINYQLAQQEDKTAIFDEWCSFLNFFDSSIHFELSFMNLSGGPVREMANYFKIDPETELIVIYDDIDLEPGQLRIRKQGSAGGHNGIKDIIRQLGTEKFLRIKVGVGAKPKGWDLADHVLGRFSTEDRKLVDEAIEKAAKAVDIMISQGADAAMNEYNRKVPVQK